MTLFKILLLFSCFDLIFGHPTNLSHYGHKQLTAEQIKRLHEWTEDSKQSIWELSGQFQGDIVLQPGQRNGKVDEKYRWPNNEIPYEVSPFFDNATKDHIASAIEMIGWLTCLKIRPATWQDDDLVVIRPQVRGCSSGVGYHRGTHYINLEPASIGRGCLQYGVIQHEFLHVLGFEHMQSDSVRDNFVTIVEKNIIKGEEINFEKFNSSEVTSFGEPYDYRSIMHYGPYAFSSNGEKTIITKDPNAVIGQRWGLSLSDENKIKKMYNCPP